MLTGQVANGGVAYACAVRVISGNASITGTTLMLQGHCDLAFASATSYRGDDPQATVLSTLDNAMQKGYDCLLAEHIADFSPIMKACTLQFPQDEALEQLP